MGSIVVANCGCGYEKEMHLGGGMMNFETYCGFPVYCPACEQLFVANLFEEPIRCPECSSNRVLPYDAEELCVTKGSVVFDWFVEVRNDRALELTNGEYLCPDCGQFTLSFHMRGFWD